MLRALQERFVGWAGSSGENRPRSRSRGRRRSVDSVALFPLTERDGSRSPLDRQPTKRNGIPTVTGYVPGNKKLCPTCVRAHWSWQASEAGSISDAPPPMWSPNHHHLGPNGMPVTPVGYASTPGPEDKQCGAYFDIPIETYDEPQKAGPSRTPTRFEFKQAPPGPRSPRYPDPCGSTSPRRPPRPDPPPT